MSRILLAAVVLSLFLPACSTNNVTEDNSFQAYFDSAGVKGSFALFDNGHGHFTICNVPRYRDSFYTPGASFDILQSLIAVQTGVLKNESALMPADSATARLDLKDAFGDTTVLARTAFRELARRLGRDTLKKWVDTLQYGNKSLGGSDKSLGDDGHPAFWESGALRINGDQQLGLLKKLYFNQLPFFSRTQEIVTAMFRTENKTSFRLAYKLAQEPVGEGETIGWVMGWVEENKHPYFFVVNLESGDGGKDLRRTGLDIAKKILQKLGFFQGQK